jgi:dolichyl-phosphate-mannose-protein mannosyltransferase
MSGRHGSVILGPMGNATGRIRLTRWLLAIVTVIGLIVRLSGPGRLHLDQFDEGIYALSGLWSLSDAGLSSLDPMIVPYAPPIFPILIGLSYRVAGVNDLAAFLPSLLAGTLTIAAIGQLAWRSYGPAAGLAAATFAAFSGAHAEFSRMALTDATFLLTWLIAVLAGQRFLERPNLGRAISLGLATGLAWNTKYNGWLPGVIVCLAAVWNAALDPDARRRSALDRVFGLGAFAGLVSIFAYLPWAIFVDRHGGYAALTAHQRSYLSGPSAWLPHWRIQLAQVMALSGPPIRGIFCWVAACGMAAYVSGVGSPRLRIPALRDTRIFSPVLAGLLASWLAPDFGWWAGLILFPRTIFDSRCSVRLLGFAWLVPAILTPFYHPYARLWLPLHAAGWLLTAGAIGEILSESSTSRKASSLREIVGHPGMLLTLACVAAILHWQVAGPRPRPLIPPALGEGRGLAGLPGLIQHRLAGDRLGVSILARPPALFYLGAAGIMPRRLGGIDGLAAARAGPGLILVDEAVLDPAASAEFRRNYGEAATTLLSEPLRPVTMLDVDPSAAFSADPRRPYRVYVLDSRRSPARP